MPIPTQESGTPSKISQFKTPPGYWDSTATWDSIYPAAAPPVAAPPPSGGGSGGGGGGAVAPVLDPAQNPYYLASIANINATEAQGLSGFRAQQDAARRALSDLLGDIAWRQDKTEDRTKVGLEGRGLLRSGETERMLADVSEAAGMDRAKGEQSTADSIANLERAIADARLAAQQSRADSLLAASNIQSPF